MTGKNVTPERQMAMMRTYLNELKDNTESELYDIKWENLSKPLREKIDALDRYQVQNDEMMNYISANMVTADYLQANYLTASQIDAKYITAQAVIANYVSTNYLQSNYLTANQIEGNYASFNWVESNYLTADQVYAREINANKITSGTVSASRISSAIMRTDDFTAYTIASKFSSGTNATFADLRATQLTCTSYKVGSHYGSQVTLSDIEIAINGHAYVILGRQMT